jgi:four helix bundle protein
LRVRAGLALRHAAHRLAPSAWKAVPVRRVAAQMQGGDERERSARARHEPCASAARRARARPHGAPGQAQEMTMFDALEMSLKVLERLAPIEARIRCKSLSLAKQIATASESISLNLGEGRLRHDGDKRRHFQMASGSASEVTVALRIAIAKHYITAAEAAEVEEVLDRVRAMLYRLTR